MISNVSLYNDKFAVYEETYRLSDPLACSESEFLGSKVPEYGSEKSNDTR